MYLGRALNLRAHHDMELDHLLGRAWAKFGVYRKELTNKNYPLKQRMRLFNAVITPSVLYGCCSWVMTKTRAQRLRTTQRKMLRSILGKGRKSIEMSDQSSTMDSVGVPDWVEEQQRRKWRWCGHVCRRLDGRWPTKLLNFVPTSGRRSQAHPKARWTDDIAMFLAKAYGKNDASLGGSFEECSHSAMDRGIWSNLESDFVNFCRDRA